MQKLKERNEEQVHRLREAPSLETMKTSDTRRFDDATFPVGSVSFQGDVICVRIKALPASAKPSDKRQLVDGDSEGSKHILSTGNVFTANADEIFAAVKEVCPHVEESAAKYVGPLFTAKEGTAYLEHPRHGHQVFEGDDMCIATIGQRSLDHELREQRTRD